MLLIRRRTTQNSVRTVVVTLQHPGCLSVHSSPKTLNLLSLRRLDPSRCLSVHNRLKSLNLPMSLDPLSLGRSDLSRCLSLRSRLKSLNSPMSLDLLSLRGLGSVENAGIQYALRGPDMRDTLDAGNFVPNLPRMIHLSRNLRPYLFKRLHRLGRLGSANAATNHSGLRKQDVHDVLDAGTFVPLHLHRLHRIPPHNARSVSICCPQATISRVVQNADPDEARCQPDHHYSLLGEVPPGGVPFNLVSWMWSAPTVVRFTGRLR
jgi:hypothetical protein